MFTTGRGFSGIKTLGVWGRPLKKKQNKSDLIEYGGVGGQEDDERVNTAK